MKKENGITLIALVITIILLLILVGVSIAMLTGENGILTNAQMSAFKTELSQIQENVEMKKAEVSTEQIVDNKVVKLFEETLEQRSDIEVPDTFKQEVMYLRDNKPTDKSQNDYEAENFDITGLLVVDKETGNGKKDTYAYDEITGIVLKIPKTNIGGKVYHSIEGTGGEEGTGSTTVGSIQDEASVVIVDEEYYYEPDLKGFDGKNTEIVYYSSDFTQQITKNAEEYINEGKQNSITQDGTNYQFHNYKNHQWANVKTTGYGLEAWWVWIPRYAYKVNGTSNSEKPISIIYVDLENKPLNPIYNGVLPEGYEVHSSFTPSGEDGSRKNLKGIWMSKYEPSYERGEDDEIATPDMTGFDKNNTYIELYDSTTQTFTEVKLADADLSTVNNSNQWYDYSKQQWANVKTTGNGLESWWVWIPRYAYNENFGIPYVNAIFVDENNKPINKKAYPNGLPEGYIVHPAFTPTGEDGSSKKLKGIWMSKYEPSFGEGKVDGGDKLLAPDMTGFDPENTYIELYDSTSNKFTSEIKLADANLETINNSKEWYNYTEKQWANIKTMASGEEAWWVWIPRYAYKTEYNTTTIIFIDENNKPINTEVYPNGLPEDFIIHPAFNPKGEDGSSKNLKGIWMSKYEPSQK